MNLQQNLDILIQRGDMVSLLSLYQTNNSIRKYLDNSDKLRYLKYALKFNSQASSFLQTIYDYLNYLIDNDDLNTLLDIYPQHDIIANYLDRDVILRRYFEDYKKYISDPNFPAIAWYYKIISLSHLITSDHLSDETKYQILYDDIKSYLISLLLDNKSFQLYLDYIEASMDPSNKLVYDGIDITNSLFNILKLEDYFFQDNSNIPLPILIKILPWLYQPDEIIRKIEEYRYTPPIEILTLESNRIIEYIIKEYGSFDIEEYDENLFQLNIPLEALVLLHNLDDTFFELAFKYYDKEFIFKVINEMEHPIIELNGNIINKLLLLQKDYITAIQLLKEVPFKLDSQQHINIVARLFYRLIFDNQYDLAQFLYNLFDSNYYNESFWHTIFNAMILRNDLNNIEWILDKFHIPKLILDSLLISAKKQNKSEVINLLQKYTSQKTKSWWQFW